MTVKLIEPPLRRGDSYIIAVDGKLRFVDQLRVHICHGYQNACVCTECLERAKHLVDPRVAAVCECEHPIRDSDTDDCWKCGHALPRLQEAA